jgi:hypothetical protein
MISREKLQGHPGIARGRLQFTKGTGSSVHQEVVTISFRILLIVEPEDTRNKLIELSEETDTSKATGGDGA